MLKIGFDAKRALFNHTGLGNYSRTIISGLSNQFPEHEYFLFTPQNIQESKFHFLKNRKNIKIISPRLQIFGSLWRSYFMIKSFKKKQLNLFHGLSNELPLGISHSGVPSIVTIHDLIFIRYPQYYNKIDRIIYRLKFKYACKNADKIIAASEQTKKDIQNYFQINPDKIKVLYQSCHPDFSKNHTKKEIDPVRAKFNLPERYILNVGTIESRKNIMVIIKALPLLPKEITLICIGKETQYAAAVKEEIQKLKLEERVIFLKNVPFKDLILIYQLAEIFIFPSEFEGFGIPVLESLNAGVPVIAAKGSCLEEVGGKHSLYIEPHDHQLLAHYIKDLWFDEGKRNFMIQEGKKHSQLFDNNLLTIQLMNLYEETIRGKAIDG